jgi:hypothetical protein
VKTLIRATLIALATLAIAAGGVSATQPAPDHKVTICHATPPDTAENGWRAITVDIASTGYQHSGHQDQHDADIIPAYDYPGFTFAGKNLDTYFYGVLGADILANGCVNPKLTQPSVTPSVAPSVLPSMANTATALDSTTGPPLPWVAILLGVIAGSMFVLTPRRAR